jgi:hypothetical protein
MKQPKTVYNPGTIHGRGLDLSTEPRATGCVSVGTFDPTSEISLDRVVETFQPVWDRFKNTFLGCTIWVDYFIRSDAKAPTDLYSLHAGNLLVSDDTHCWSPVDGVVDPLTERLVTLHERGPDFLAVEERTVTIGGHDEKQTYRIDPTATSSFRVLQGGITDTQETQVDVPYTLWRLGSFLSGYYVVRSRLEMQQESLLQQLGNTGNFDAYGEDILLPKILRDASFYDGPNAAEYKRGLERFCSGSRTVPDIFEYIITSSEDAPFDWTLTSKSNGTEEQTVPPSKFAENTRGFVNRNALAAKWSMSGKAVNEFVVNFAVSK